MKRTLLSLAMMALMHAAVAQSIDFESANLDLDTFKNQTDSADTAFVFENFVFPNNYDTAFGGYWDGWSISTMRDDSTSGYANQYSAIAGGGKSADTYVVGYPSFSEGLYVEIKPYLDTRIKLESMQVCNNAYAYYSMLNGDGFAKKFGGSSGEDPDYLILHIMLEIEGQVIDTIDFYLADYTSADSSEDYIVDEWTEVDLSVFDTSTYSNAVLRFGFSSSDTSFGFINTPTYVCVDDLEYSFLYGVEEAADAKFPQLKWTVNGQFEITSEEMGHWNIYNLSGQRMAGGAIVPGTGRDLIQLTSGVYIMEMVTKTGRSSVKVWNR